MTPSLKIPAEKFFALPRCERFHRNALLLFDSFVYLYLQLHFGPFNWAIGHAERYTIVDGGLRRDAS